MANMESGERVYRVVDFVSSVKLQLPGVWKQEHPYGVSGLQTGGKSFWGEPQEGHER